MPGKPGIARPNPRRHLSTRQGRNASPVPQAFLGLLDGGGGAVALFGGQRVEKAGLDPDAAREEGPRLFQAAERRRCPPEVQVALGALLETHGSRVERVRPFALALERLY